MRSKSSETWAPEYPVTSPRRMRCLLRDPPGVGGAARVYAMNGTCSTPFMTRGEGQRGDLELGTIPRLVRRAAERFGELAALTDEGVSLTFVDLAAAVARAARALAALGVAP